MAIYSVCGECTNYFGVGSYQVSSSAGVMGRNWKRRIRGSYSIEALGSPIIIIFGDFPEDLRLLSFVTTCSSKNCRFHQ